MEIFLKTLFFVSLFIIIWAMLGYPLSMKIINRFYKTEGIRRDYRYQPTVTILVVAHNEERVILEKLHNILAIDYPKEKIEFVISSDNSTDKTNEIVRKFISENTDYSIRLYEVKARKGKTNAQNEAQKTVTTEYLVMTDANSMLDTNSVKELMATFTSDEIVYVTGKLKIINKDSSDVSNAESSYWNNEMLIREIESKIKTITAGNGALYACRNSEYKDFDLIESHDSAMPLYYALEGKRAVSNHNAVAFEKAGETLEDEFGRKVRMNRVILKHILPDIRILNIFKYGWFTYFYLGHRTCRYLLWISHLLLIILSALLIGESWIYFFAFLIQIIFFTLALIKFITKTENKYLTMIYYYVVTIIAQWVGVYKIISMQTKPYWEKAESTR